MSLIDRDGSGALFTSPHPRHDQDHALIDGLVDATDAQKVDASADAIIAAAAVGVMVDCEVVDDQV